MVEQIIQFIQANFIISVSASTFILVQVIKQFVNDKRYMYVVALVLGVAGAVALNQSITFEIFVAGLASGAVAIVTYDYGVEELTKDRGEEPHRKGE